jgi:hypothetical protein
MNVSKLSVQEQLLPRTGDFIEGGHESLPQYIESSSMIQSNIGSATLGAKITMSLHILQLEPSRQLQT